MKHHTHAQFIQRCIEIARNGGQKVSPNPMVGSVLVEDNEIIGEGFHASFGKSHAEARTFASVKPENLPRVKNAVLYVSLEPCNIFGKTPPCTQLILDKKVKTIVISALDATPEVNGMGVSLLQKNNLNVIQGILSEKGNKLVAQRNIFVTKKRPYTILKLVVSSDGFYASHKNENIWLSQPVTSRLTHKWRSESDAILVGTKTAWIDNPILDTRYFPGRNPERFVLDKNGLLAEVLHLFNEPNPAKRFTSAHSDNQRDIPIHLTEKNQLSLSEIASYFYKHNIGCLLVEGGGKLIENYLETDLWDEFRLIKTKKRLMEGKQINLPHILPNQSFELGEDTIEIYLNKKPS